MIKFIEKSHRYIDEKDRDLISVSKFMEKFKEKVDWNKIAERSAKKASSEGEIVTKEDILKKWANKRDKAAEIGTLFHSIREMELIEANSCNFYDNNCQVRIGTTDNTYKYSIPINNLENNSVYPELMIYDEEHMICGQSDKVIVVDNFIHIWDFKTDAEITFKGFSNKWTSARKLLKPLDHLDDCNGNIYSIKMSMYMYMLWKANKGRFKPGDIMIEHVHLKRDPDNDNLPVLENGRPVVLKIEQIKLPYRKKEVIAMLKMYDSKNI